MDTDMPTCAKAADDRNSIEIASISKRPTRICFNFNKLSPFADLALPVDVSIFMQILCN